MPNLHLPRQVDRDGTSQTGRWLASLSPASAAIDERGLQDLLAFADAFSRELVYFDDGDQPAGDWRGFLNPDGPANLAEIADFVADPTRFDDDSVYRRPHFVLFLAFLQLIGLSSQRLNRLTGEHLDYYYRCFLGLQKKRASPDTVNVIAKPAAGVEQTILPQGTLLDAGKNSQGEAVHYRTNDELIVNRAQVAGLRSLFVDKRVIGIRETREASLLAGDDPRQAMFRLVYGDPQNDYRLPDYPPTGQPLDTLLFDRLAGLVDFLRTGLHLDIAEFEQLILLKTRRQQAEAADWSLINGILQKIAAAELSATTYTIPSEERTAFWKNYRKAFKNGQPPDLQGLPGDIDSLEDLYSNYLIDKNKDDVLAFIRHELHLEPADFAGLMASKQAVDSDWRIINGLLEVAGQRKRKDAAYRLLNDSPADPYQRASTGFDQNLQSALQPDFSAFSALFDDGVSDLAHYAVALEQVRSYFFCSLEDLARLAHTQAQNKPEVAEWQRCDAILSAAYAKRVYADRRQWLANCRTGVDDQAALEAMLRLASALRTASSEELLNQLANWWPESDSDRSIYQIIRSRLTGQESSTSPFSQPVWQNVVNTLELAWRQREGAPPVVQREDWSLLHAWSDATRCQAQRPGDTPRWHTFGQQSELLPVERRPAAQIGWSIASPALCLSQGERRIKLTLLFPAESFASQIASVLSASQPEDGPLQIELSSEKGWITPSDVQISIGKSTLSGKDHPQIAFTLAIARAAPALTAPPDGTSSWPMLRLMLRPIKVDSTAANGSYSTLYPLFRPLTLNRVRLDVQVAGLRELALANDDGPLVAGKPCEPFGANPAAGAAFHFTHAELVVKRLQGMTLNLQWMNVPVAKLATYYAAYAGAGIADNKNITARFSLRDHGTDLELAGQATLFDDDDAGKPHPIEMSDLPSAIEAVAAGHDGLLERVNIDAQVPTNWLRSWRLELNSPDFQHASYARVVAAKSIELATAITVYLKAGSTASAPDANNYKVNPPYTPKLKSFSIDYTCSVELNLDPADPPSDRSGEERLFHHHPFGVSEIQPESATGRHHFLPAYDNAGELYLGLENALVPGQVAILLQMADGSANPDLPAQPVVWSYLSDNRWHGLSDGGVLADGTRSLAQSGIIRFQLPAARPNTLLPADRYWLRAAVTQDCASVCDCIAIVAQAVSATRVANENDPAASSAPLPAGRIAKTMQPLPGIASIAQPYSSAGGRAAEQESAFNLRVSERLRHKQRALTMWDYERLVLERFPSIYKIKCIPSAAEEPADLGNVNLIVIPDIRGRLPFNPFEPKATVGQIAEIGDFIAGLISPLAKVTVKNAHYVPVRVRFAVRFMPGVDTGLHKLRLNDELNRFLSPWAYDGACEVVIGGTIYANTLIDFLERQAGVDYVAELRLFKSEDGQANFTLVQESGDGTGYRVQPERPDGVLVADRQHEIDLISDTRFESEKFSGIGYMKIELDFVVG